MWPAVSNFVTIIILNKADSSSAANRSAADRFSFDVLYNTAGLGSGLGSNRPSSFVAALLSTVGVLGTSLLVSALVLVLVRAFGDVRYQPAVWSTVVLLVSKSVSGPDISEPVLWFLVAVCAQGAWQSRARHAGVVLPNRSGAVATNPHLRNPVVVLDDFALRSKAGSAMGRRR